MSATRKPKVNADAGARVSIGRGSVDRPKLPTIVADQITQSILEGELTPGSRLQPEHEMLEAFGVGRATLREALRLLESEGLITLKTGPGGGPIVQRPDLGRVTRLLLIVLLTSGTSLRHVYDARSVLDPLIATLAAERATPDQTGQLQESLEVMREALHDEEAFLRENLRFHRLVAESSGNPVLEAYSFLIQDILDGHEMGIHYSVQRLRGTLDSHIAIVDGIAAHDPARASKAAAKHVAEAVTYFERKYPGQLDAPVRATAWVNHT
jgi:GntR family transcriptional regulator, transcriptional repressor for pyruvate dehydrogenase complex